MIISIDTEKAFNKNSTNFHMVKNIQQTRNKNKLLHYDKESTANIIFKMAKKTEVFSSNKRKRQKCPLLALLFNIATTIREEKT